VPGRGSGYAARIAILAGEFLMGSSALPPEERPASHTRITATVVFGILGALAPIGVALYEHRVHFLPIRAIEILWPSSMVFFPDPGRRFPILYNALSVGLNAAIYAVVGFVIGVAIEVLRSRANTAAHD